MNKISILIPVYNEKNSLLEILKRVEAVDFGLEKEIILIDDGSVDKSLEICNEYKSKYDNGDYNANGSITGKPIYEAVNNGSTIYYVDDSLSGSHFANRYYTMTSIWIADSCGDGNFNIDCTYTSWEYDTSGAYVCRENTLNMGFTNA